MKLMTLFLATYVIPFSVQYWRSTLTDEDFHFFVLYGIVWICMFIYMICRKLDEVLYLDEQQEEYYIKPEES